MKRMVRDDREDQKGEAGISQKHSRIERTTQLESCI